MKKLLLMGTVVLAAAAAPVLAQQQPAAATKANGTSAKAAADHAWAMNVAKDGMAEVELGRLATEKASSNDVKMFGQRMVDDHSKANDELKMLAQSKSITLPAAADAKHKATHDRLAKLSGAAFDRAYAQAMLADHRQAVASFKKESQSGNDPDLKAFATKTLPTLQDHLKMAEDINHAGVGTAGHPTSSTHGATGTPPGAAGSTPGGAAGSTPPITGSTPGTTGTPGSTGTERR